MAKEWLTAPLQFDLLFSSRLGVVVDNSDDADCGDSLELATQNVNFSAP